MWPFVSAFEIIWYLQDLSLVWHVSIPSSFLYLSNIPLYTYLLLFFYSSFGKLVFHALAVKIMLTWTFACKVLCKCMFSVMIIKNLLPTTTCWSVGITIIASSRHSGSRRCIQSLWPHSMALAPELSWMESWIASGWVLPHLLADILWCS